jgi:hypothetical protein
MVIGRDGKVSACAFAAPDSVAIAAAASSLLIGSFLTAP